MATTTKPATVFHWKVRIERYGGSRWEKIYEHRDDAATVYQRMLRENWTSSGSLTPVEAPKDRRNRHAGA